MQEPTPPAITGDSTTTVSALRETVALFVRQRDWEQFHSPKNLSMALAIEVAELMEHFQWISTEKSRSIGDDAVKRGEIADEMADIFCYLLGLSNELDIDLSHALDQKMIKNRLKYPADVYFGKYGQDDLE